MEKQEEVKKEFKLYQKWWFWLILLGIAIAIGFTIIMVMAFNIAIGGINEVAIEVQKIDKEATLYTSAGGNVVIIEVPNYSDDTKKEKVERIKSKIKSYAQNDKVLSNYSKLIISSKINKDNAENFYLSNNVYTLPNLEPDIENGSLYIDFIQYTKDTLNNTATSNNIENKGEDITLTAGKYIVGNDIKEGKYDAIAQANHGNFFVNGSTSVNEILSAKNDGFGIPKYSNIILKNGDKVEITSGLKILLQAK